MNHAMLATIEETPRQRLKRLRPLVPNTVSDRAILVRIEEGWSDERIVTTDLTPQYTGRPPKMYRGAR